MLKLKLLNTSCPKPFVPETFKMPVVPEVFSPVLRRWNRMVTRLWSRARWHWHGLMLWLIQRPYLRFTPPPLPPISNDREWKVQAVEMVQRGSWPRRWLPKGNFGVMVLKDAIALRKRMGNNAAYVEDPFVLQAFQMMRKKGKHVVQKAIVDETHRLMRVDRAGQELRLHTLIGPRGGLPRLRSELVELCTLLFVDVDDKDTVEKLKNKLAPVILAIKGDKSRSGLTIAQELKEKNAEAEAKAAASAAASGPYPAEGLRRGPPKVDNPFRPCGLGALKNPNSPHQMMEDYRMVGLEDSRMDGAVSMVASVITDPDQMSVMLGEMEDQQGPEMYDLNAFERQANP